jgi:hypothetical protein
MLSPWTIQDGPYWRSRAELLRRTANETGVLRPEIRARMLRIAQGYDVLAKRLEQCAQDKSSRSSSLPARSSRRRRDRVAGSGTTQ